MIGFFIFIFFFSKFVESSEHYLKTFLIFHIGILAEPRWRSLDYLGVCSDVKVSGFFSLQGRYKRFDRFQDDMFEVFEYGRKVGGVDSQVTFPTRESRYILLYRAAELFNFPLHKLLFSQCYFHHSVYCVLMVQGRVLPCTQVYIV